MNNWQAKAALNMSDEDGNILEVDDWGRLVLKLKDATRDRVVGFICTKEDDSDFVILMKKEQEEHIYRRRLAWTIPEAVYNVIDALSITSDRGSYYVEKSWLRPGDVYREKGGGGKLEQKVSIPIRFMAAKYDNEFEDAISQQMGYEWWLIMREEFKQKYIHDIVAFLREERKKRVIYPHGNEVFAAFHETPFLDVKVCIVGQDPYPNESAHGLSFSIREGVSAFNPSLKNIFQELRTDLGIERTNTNLTDWAHQGIMLLNTCLTVEAGKPASHDKIGWQEFTTRALQALAGRTKTHNGLPVLFVLWGNNARGLVPHLRAAGATHIFESAHPSPMSADRGFFGTKPFTAIQNHIIQHYKTDFQWT